MRHLLVLEFDDSASAQAVRSALQQTEPSQLTVLAEETIAPPENATAARKPFSASLLVRLPMAMLVGAFSGLYFGAKWCVQTMEVVSNFLAETQVTMNGQAFHGRMILLVDEAQVATFADTCKRLGVSVQQVDLPAATESEPYS